ncbi:hypothetical protein [Paenibacillus glycanilyticus]|uniref:hypothetical protein n=1 Tax=Paenibacillus glycanilyticus TaxID=126569 RepID=UPI001910E9CA|nr:hypothetical protein [Paenibacillus glycanilyticus]
MSELTIRIGCEADLELLAGLNKQLIEDERHDKLAALLDADQLDIEVMYGNEAAYAFWRSLGFKERSIYMRLER